MKRILVILLIITSFLFIGCSKEDDYLGTYTLEYYQYVGDSEDIKNTSEIGEIILESDGTGTSTRSGISHKMNWTIDGENIVISYDDINACTSTIQYC